MKFPQKLWNIVNDNSSDAVKWSSNGKTILVDYQALQSEYLFTSNSTFKTRNIDSFVRQLNLYGFKKVASFFLDNDSGTVQRSQVHEYLHDYFQANRKELLPSVCRKSTSKAQESTKKKYYVHELNNKNGEVKKNVRKSNLQECQTALKKALEQAVCDYRREKYSKDSQKTENFSLQCAFNQVELDGRKPNESEQKVCESEILTNEANLIYRISPYCSAILIPINDKVNF